jgi:hypothetical protein
MNKESFKYIKYIDIEEKEVRRTILDQPASEFMDCILWVSIQMKLKPSKANEFKMIKNYIIFSSINN